MRLQSWKAWPRTWYILTEERARNNWLAWLLELCCHTQCPVLWGEACEWLCKKRATFPHLMVSDEEMTGRHLYGCDKLMGGGGEVGSSSSIAKSMQLCPVLLGPHLALVQISHTGFVPACVPKRMTPAVHLLFKDRFSCQERDTMGSWGNVEWLFTARKWQHETVFVWQPMTGAWRSQMARCSARARSRAGSWHFPQTRVRLPKQWLLQVVSMCDSPDTLLCFQPCSGSAGRKYC